MGIAGLVLGILSLVLCWVPFVGLILGIVGLILSIIAVSKNFKRGCGIGGIVTSGIGLFLGFLITFILSAQVVRWVDKSRESSDFANYDALVSSANIASTNEKVVKELANGDIIIRFSESGVEMSQNGSRLKADSSFLKSMRNTLGDTFEEDLCVRGYSGETFVITISSSKKGVFVSRTHAPD